MKQNPLVSCIMPTHDRRPFVAQAIRYFRCQDYEPSELLIVDDGSDPIADLVPEDPRVRYLRHEQRMSLGAKRNLACREAKGEVVVHWDDDDWHAPWRLTYQVARLREHGTELCGLDRLYFYDPKGDRAWQYAYPPGGGKWLAGGTLCYARSFWQDHPFPDVTVGEDNRFVRAAGAGRVVALEDGDFYVALIHQGNTSRKRTAGRRWRPVSSSKVRALLGDDNAFYAGSGGRPPAGGKPAAASRATEADGGDVPLVSCIMPTCDRRRFVPDALRYFLRQDYPHLELVILDDGSDPIADLVPEDPRIRYRRLDRRHPLGAKRNLGCEAASGEIIAFWDDDDWYAPHRVSYQVAPLLAGQADLTVLGETTFHCYSSGEFWTCSPALQRRMFHRGMVGGTQVLFKKLWRHGPRYPAKSLAEEIDFVKKVSRRGARIETLANDGVFVYGRHDSNSWNFATGDYLDRRGWRRLERPAFLPAGDLEAGSAPPAPRPERPKGNKAEPRPEHGVGKRASEEAAPAPAADPLVSCVMATGDRRAFVRQAIQYFQRQTYAAKELILVDDGERSSADLVPDDSRIRYLRLSARTNLGRKLNLGIEQARGSIIQKLDDDDYYHPEFLKSTVSALLPHRSTGAVVGLDSFLVLLAATGQLKVSGTGWCAGPSLCFFRELWRKKPFRDAPRAVDYWFLKDHRVPRIKVKNPELLILVRHGGGHLWQHMGKRTVEDFFRRAASHTRPLAECIPAEDLEFYRRLERRLREASAPQAAAVAAVAAGDSSASPAWAAPSGPPVSACLISWKRPRNMQRIVDSLEPHDFIDEILVWNNNPEVRLDLGGKKVRVIESPENTLCYGRFLCAFQAKNPIVYVQDDDVLVHNVAEIYRRFLADGSRITHALRRRHYGIRDRYSYPDSHVALLGWGAFFQKEWLSVLDLCARDGGSDYLFQREADQFFSILLGRQHQTLLARATGLPDETAPRIALYRQAHHRRNRSLAVRRARSLLRQSREVKYPVPWNVVITCRDYGRYLQEAVDSVLANDADYQITIVDDGSEDETPAIARRIAGEHSHVSWIRHETSRGVGRSRNAGAAGVDSLYLVFLDADDKIGPDYLFAAERLLGSGCDLANPDAILFGKESGRWRLPETVTFEMLLRRNFIHCCAAFKRSCWAQVGGVDEGMKYWQDYDFWIRVVRAGARVRRLDGDHFYYRRHAGSKTCRADQLRDQLQAEILSRYGFERSERATRRPRPRPRAPHCFSTNR